MYGRVQLGRLEAGAAECNAGDARRSTVLQIYHSHIAASVRWRQPNPQPLYPYHYVNRDPGIQLTVYVRTAARRVPVGCEDLSTMALHLGYLKGDGYIILHSPTRYHIASCLPRQGKYIVSKLPGVVPANAMQMTEGPRHVASRQLPIAICCVCVCDKKAVSPHNACYNSKHTHRILPLYSGAKWNEVRTQSHTMHVHRYTTMVLCTEYG